MPLTVTRNAKRSRVVGRMELRELDTPERRKQLADWLRNRADDLEQAKDDTYGGPFRARFWRDGPRDGESEVES
jgi:hypothetical protein